MIKVLAIIGSPRKGNSYQLTQMIEERLKNHKEIEFEYLFLKDLDLDNYTGCQSCIVNGKESCPLDDDRDIIEQKIHDADGVIFVSPVYNFHITALMKNFVDHFTYAVHRPRFFDKKAMIFIQRGKMFKKALKYMEKVVHAWGFDVVSTLGIPDVDPLTEKYKKKSIKELEKATDRFYEGLKKNELPSPTVYDLVWFNVWKMNAEVNKEVIPADYVYWKNKGWFDMDYYYKVRINPLKKGIAYISTVFAKKFMKKVFKDY